MKHAFRLIAAASLAVGLAACTVSGDDHSDGGAAAMTLKIYAVPQAQTDQLSESLGKALGKTANVTVPASGKLLVYAPAGAQNSIGAAITSLGKLAPVERAPAQVELHFWVVDAQSGAGVDDAALKPLASALDAVRQNMGPLHFQVAQAVTAITSMGHDGSLKTGTLGIPRGFGFEVHAVQDNTIDLSVSYDDRGQLSLAQFETRIAVQSGHYVVLAQAPGGCSVTFTSPPPGACPDKPALRLLIVRADRLNPAA